MNDKTRNQNRIRDALARIYDDHPPHFREYLRRYQQDPKSRVFAPLAEAYRKLGRLEDAIDVCVKGLEHHPDFYGGRVALARCYFDKKLMVEAREQLEMVVDKVPENLLAQRLLGEVHWNLDDKVAARHAIEKAHALAPDDTELTEKLRILEKEVPEAKSVEAQSVEVESLEAKPVKAQSVEVESLEAKPVEAENVEVESLKIAQAEALEDSGQSAEVKPEPLRDLAVELGAFESSIEASPGENSLWSRNAGEQEPIPAQASAQEPKSNWDGRDYNGEAVVESSFIRQVPVPLPGNEAKERLPFSDKEAQFGIARVLGFDEDDSEEAFKVEHIGEVFGDDERNREITTETIGDLYFSQGQFDRSLRIFEKLGGEAPSAELERKINACRVKLGVDEELIERRKKIELLQGVLERVQNQTPRNQPESH